MATTGETLITGIDDIPKPTGSMKALLVNGSALGQETLTDCFYASIPNGAAAHNAAPPRNKNITSYFTDGSLFTRISNGTFEDLFIGDYFEVSMPAMGSLRTAGTVRFILVAFDYYYNCGDTALTRHHAVIIPYNSLFTHAWNASGSTEGGYANSDIHKLLNSGTDGVKSSYQSVFGNNLITFRDLLSNAVNMNADSPAYPGQKGASSNWVWTDVTIRLMSEVMIYGSTVWSSSGFDTGCACIQLPYFKNEISERITHRQAYIWLSDVVSASRAATAVNNGHAHNGTVTGAPHVRPLALIS